MSSLLLRLLFTSFFFYYFNRYVKFTQRERRKGKAPIIDPYAVGACKQIYGMFLLFFVDLLHQFWFCARNHRGYEFFLK